MREVRKGSTKRKVNRKQTEVSASSRAKRSSPRSARNFLFASARLAEEVESPYSLRIVTSHESRVTRKRDAGKKRMVHPYVRAAFLSLGVGTAMLLASTLYYVRVSAATAPFLEGRMITREAASAVTTSTTVGLDQDAAADAGGVPAKAFPRAYLREQAGLKGFNAELLEKIAHCESNWRMVKNKKSTATGFFQILDGTERLTPQFKDGLSKDDPYVNIDMALALYEKYGTIPWYESRECWER